MKAIVRLLVAVVLAVIASSDDVRGAVVDEPKYIRVCEKTPCSGLNVLLLRFETEYLPDALPNEWICSWTPASVKAGAIAVRTYAWWRVEHPRAPEFDLWGNSNDQNYRSGSAHPTCDSRLEATAGTRVEYAAKPIFAAYRAETGSPTQDGGKPYLVPVNDPHSGAGTIGPGTCQRGSQEYGTAGWTSSAILRHYYTAVAVASGAQVFLSESYRCTPSGRVRDERWLDTNDGSTYTRSFAGGACPDLGG
jgi:hypothetical protein